MDPENLLTTAPGIFAAGDCALGPRLLIDSVADGKRAAAGIDRYLSGRRPPEPAIEVETLPHHRMPGDFMTVPHQPVPTLPLEQRTGTAEVELGYDEDTARAEARRCLRCWINTVFDRNAVEASRCTLCGGCVEVCPEDCLQLVSLDRLEFSPGVTETLQENRQLLGGGIERCGGRRTGDYCRGGHAEGRNRCIRCGLCADRCPVKTITMEAYNLVTS